MQHSEFLQRFVDGLRSTLPDERRPFETRFMGGLVKVWYGNPAVHYELALRSNGIMEVGLHFEADKQTNDRLLSYFSDQAIDVISQLGPQTDIEQWTETWGRVHQTVPFSTANDQLLAEAIKRMAAMITVLQPMLEET